LVSGTNVTIYTNVTGDLVIAASGGGAPAATGFVTNEFTTNTTVTLADFQPACNNLTDWCAIPTNFVTPLAYTLDLSNHFIISLVTNEFTTNTTVTLADFQPACANLTDWCAIPTNILSGFQAACANLNDWCLFSTNKFASTNYVASVSNYFESKVVSTPNVLFTDDGSTNQAGYNARGHDNGVAVGGWTGAGQGAQANTYGAAVGKASQGQNYGAAIGYQSRADDYGATVGYLSEGRNYGAAVGYKALGVTFGVGVGYQANGQSGGVSIGYNSYTTGNGVAIGYNAKNGAAGYAANRAIAIGYQAVIPNDWNATIELGEGTATLNGGLNIWGKGIADSSAKLYGNTVTATNGVIQQMTNTFGTNFTCVSHVQFYCCSGTNQLLRLPNATNSVGIILRFSSTNANGSILLTNWTGDQTVNDGVSLDYTNSGAGCVSFISDGAHWWNAGK